MDYVSPDLPAVIAETLQIREARFSDLRLLEWNGEYAHLRRLYHEIFYHTIEQHALMWVAVSTGYPMIGQVFVQLKSKRTSLADGKELAYVFSFRVVPDLRGCGIGSRMMNVVEKDLQERGYKRVCLNVVKTNFRAREFYLRHGYLVTREDPGEWSYQDNDGSWHHMKEPAWRLEKSLE